MFNRYCPLNTPRLINAGLMLVHRLRRRPSITPAMLFSGWGTSSLLDHVNTSEHVNYRTYLDLKNTTSRAANTENISHSPNAGLMLGHRRRHWPNLTATLGQRLLFDGNILSDLLIFYVIKRLIESRILYLSIYYIYNHDAVIHETPSNARQWESMWCFRERGAMP